LEKQLLLYKKLLHCHLQSLEYFPAFFVDYIKLVILTANEFGNE